MKKPTARTLLTFMVKMMIPIILIEIISWALYTRTPPVGRMNIAYLLGDDSMLEERPHPYLLWEFRPYAIIWGYRQTNGAGYRNPQEFGPKNEQKTRILALGGSTTWGYGAPDPNDAWPIRLERLLENTEVVNGGLRWGTSAELLLHYLYRDRYLDSDLVILHVGVNDAVPLLYHDYVPDYSTWRTGWVSGLHRLRRGERMLVAHSRFVRFFYACWLSDNLALPHIDKTPVYISESESYYFENAVRNEPTGFRRNMELLIRNIIDDGAIPVLFAPIMPAYEDLLGIPDAQAQAYRTRLFKGHRLAVTKNMQVLRELSEKYDIHLLEMPPGCITGEMFLDYCHVNPEGQRMQAEFLAEAIRQSGILEQKSNRQATEKSLDSTGLPRR